MNDATMTIAPRYLAASTVDEHHVHLLQLAKTAAWMLRTTPLTTTVTSPCGLVTVHADRRVTADAAHLFLSARTHPDWPERWKMTLGGELPVEFLAAITTALSAELERDPDRILYNLPSDGRLVVLPGPGTAGWDVRADPGLVEWQARHRGSRALALLRDRNSSAPPLAGGEDTLLMAAATLATREGMEVIWWAGFSHGTPAPVTGAFLDSLVGTEPITRRTDGFARPDLVPVFATAHTMAGPPSPVPPGPRSHPRRAKGSR